MELKTLAVAKQLGVSTKTIQRWVKKYNIPYFKNDAGHFLFNQHALSQLEQIKFEQAATLEGVWDDAHLKQADIEACIAEQVTFQFHMFMDEHNFNQRLKSLEETSHHLNRELGKKADDVATFQLLQHRREIEELSKQIKSLTRQLNALKESPIDPTEPSKLQKKRSIMGFSF